jgi:hypothetical protein
MIIQRGEAARAHDANDAAEVCNRPAFPAAARKTTSSVRSNARNVASVSLIGCASVCPASPRRWRGETDPHGRDRDEAAQIAARRLLLKIGKTLNHTIVRALLYLTEILGLPAPFSLGPFAIVRIGGGNVARLRVADEITFQHYTFLVSEAELDEIFARIRARRRYWADPMRKEPDRINRRDDRRGV